MLRQANCIKRALTTVAFALLADAGESFLIKSIICGATDLDTDPTLRVDRKTVGFYRAKAQGRSHLGHIDDTFLPMNLMDWLMGKGINMAIPVGEGQTFTIDRGGSHTGDVTVIYDIYDAGDIRPDMVNGTDSKEYNFIQYMTASEVLKVAKDYELSVSLSPAEFPDFPCGAVVPARSKIDILGIAGMPVNVGDDTNYTGTTHLKLIKDREILFDEDRLGIPFLATLVNSVGTFRKIAFSLIGDCVSIATGLSDPSYGLPLLFDPPLHFESGEELLVYLTCSIDAGAVEIPVADVRVAMIMNVKTE